MKVNTESIRLLSSELCSAAASRIASDSLGYEYNDGGRKAAGWKGHAGDCVTRAIAIANPDWSYNEVRAGLMKLVEEWRASSRSKRAKRRSGNSVRNGTPKEVYRPFLEALGWRRISLIEFGSPDRKYMNTTDIPSGTVIVEVRNHLAAVVDHVVHDTWDSRKSTKWIEGRPTDQMTDRVAYAVWVKD